MLEREYCIDMTGSLAHALTGVCQIYWIFKNKLNHNWNYYCHNNFRYISVIAFI